MCVCLYVRVIRAKSFEIQKHVNKQEQTVKHAELMNLSGSGSVVKNSNNLQLTTKQD